MISENKKLYIPVNVRRRKEIVSGFGQVEIMQTLISCVVGLILGTILYQIKQEVSLLILVPLILSIITAVFVMKDRTNTSFVNRVQYMIDFSRSQKRYYFVYYNIYEKELPDEKKKKYNRSENTNSK